MKKTIIFMYCFIPAFWLLLHVALFNADSCQCRELRVAFENQVCEQGKCVDVYQYVPPTYDGTNLRSYHLPQRWRYIEIKIPATEFTIHHNVSTIYSCGGGFYRKLPINNWHWIATGPSSVYDAFVKFGVYWVLLSNACMLSVYVVNALKKMLRAQTPFLPLGFPMYINPYRVIHQKKTS
jgi:hypothetical protein